MGKPPKERMESKRITAKGTRPDNLPPAGATSMGYTPSKRISSRWVAPMMFGLLGAGTAMIIVNYVDLLPGGTSNWYLLGGLGLVLAGIITATQLH
ncbi:MAG: cell division protein CrgA [Acidimicrobiales bacterium]|nr:cell division protein CrgA [Acidimicrobiales bacterium]MDP6298628.1 cell division protein CrgA [Acidimicrobiales bacterium]HJM27718.1 cell division protein CrgA [Acidimicrobiales bacterium]HJM98460.1 cell division protein CrgA [Acidimicrobiales bacterium]